MKVRDILKQQPGAVIPEFTARLVKVYPPKEQTERQAKTGIHKQNIIGQGADGTELKIVILKAPQHIPTSEAGRLYTFKSTNDDKGRMGGIITCEWTPEGRTEAEFYVEVNGQCHFYAVQEDSGAVKANRPEAAPRLPAGRDEFVPSIQYHVDFYCEIVEAMEKRLTGSAVFDALLKDPTPMFASCTSIFIQATQNGTFRRNWRPVTTSGAQYEPDGFIHPEQTPPDHGGDADAKYIELVASANWDAAMELAPSVDPERCYDLLADLLAQKHPQVVVDAAFDHIKKKISTRSAKSPREVCEAIIHDPAYFFTAVSYADNIAKQQAQAQAQQPDPASEGPPAEEVFSDALLAGDDD